MATDNAQQYFIRESDFELSHGEKTCHEMERSTP